MSTRAASSERTPLSPERIARAGLELADREGIDALSMRRLAHELGAGTMTLYGHFRDKRELLDAVIDVAIREKDLPGFAGPWRNQGRQLVDYLRDLHRRHPCVVEIWARQPVLGAAGLSWVEAGLRILEDAGFETEDAVKAFRVIVVYIHGFSLSSGPRSTPESREGARTALAALPAEHYPHLRNAARPFSEAMASEEAFKFGIERILDGLEAKLAPS
jgi:AcrR family transcriptional regulator